MHDPTSDHIRHPRISILHMEFEVIPRRCCQFLPELRSNNEVNYLLLRGHQVRCIEDRPLMGIYVDLMRIILTDSIVGVVPSYTASIG